MFGTLGIELMAAMIIYVYIYTERECVAVFSCLVTMLIFASLTFARAFCEVERYHAPVGTFSRKLSWSTQRYPLMQHGTVLHSMCLS